MLDTRRALRPGERRSESPPPPEDEAKAMGTSRSECEPPPGCGAATMGATRPEEPGAIENEVGSPTALASEEFARSRNGERGGGRQGAEEEEEEAAVEDRIESIGRNENGVEGSDGGGER